ncbi:hypothetical protein FHX49_000685 [Microbacterium endophyticum]|uniref:Uncharacterized protein n=1 Tax=Microbacterium endophyticum TaxID=1526412 RepID=A0A7W4YM43_9MICO|nr:hypothetical protein [Microbacterium endophyticum]MBB2975144.1 hypothetical protein [Microbacterium endophyticum]NIK37316.1 hypothetical protein [Microbacterium endophyticum]
MRRILVAIVIVVALATGGILISLPVQAASQGSGFGTWAPTSTYGWHGSMVVGGVHTYCIVPGQPAPTGNTVDNGISSSAAGLSSAQLTGINLLVSKYGQTSDPVQAASVGWAVKAIANWHETLHAFGYQGDSLQGAIHWTFSSLASEHDEAVQNLAAAYYTEATNTAAAPASGTGSLSLTIDEADPLRGTVTAHTDVPHASGTLALENGIFVQSGSATIENATPETTYEIQAQAPVAGRGFRVHASGTFSGGFAGAVHHFSTPGGQDTAGPAGRVEVSMSAEDAADRETTFSPVITTQVAARYVPGGRYTDDVTFAAAEGTWARDGGGDYLPVSAIGTVYRTQSEPALADEIPSDAEEVGSLALTSESSSGPTVPYRVESEWELPGPGFYTAVWKINAAEQSDEVAATLPENYSWTEQFGEVSQITMVAAISSRAQPVAAVGGTMSDDIIVDGVVPANGLFVTASVFRAPEGVAPADACTPENLVWENSEPVLVSQPGTITIEAPNVPDFGTYYWQEHARDHEGSSVHVGACGIESETTTAPLPTVTTTALAEADFGAAITDTAHVTGPVPRSGTTDLTFELYHAEGNTEPANACTPETLVETTQPIPVTDEGDYVSPEVRAHQQGSYYWIEYLWYSPSDGGERRLLAQGACGLENETTAVASPEVVTAALERAGVNESFYDNATVTGLAADTDAELVFFVFHNEPDTLPVCTEDTLEYETTVVPLDGSGEYRSPDVSSPTSGTKQWIAELRYRTAADAETLVLAKGTCGDEDESTIVSDLAVTGARDGNGMPVRQLGALGAAVLALGIGMIAISRARRTRRGRFVATLESR